MDVDSFESVECTFCLGPLLTEPVGAIRCGHVFHRDCIAKWISSQEGKAKCPQCNKPAKSDHVRTLDFMLTQMPARSPQEIARLEIASQEERERLREELTSEREAAEAAEEEAHAEMKEVQASILSSKRTREYLEQEHRRHEAEANELKVELERTSEGCAELRTSIDVETQKLQRFFPVQKARPDDPDLRDERRRLRMSRPADRARQLHEALLSAISQDGESKELARERAANVEEVESELKQLKRQESMLRRELSDLRDQAEMRSSSSQDSDQHLAERARGSADPPPAEAATRAVARQPERDAAEGRPPKTARHVAVEMSSQLRRHAGKFGSSESALQEDTDMLQIFARRAAAPAKGLLARKRPA